MKLEKLSAAAFAVSLSLTGLSLGAGCSKNNDEATTPAPMSSPVEADPVADEPGMDDFGGGDDDFGDDDDDSGAEASCGGGGCGAGKCG
jgi:hypothetical protein